MKRPWYKAKGDDLQAALWTHIDALAQDAATRRENIRAWRSLYTGRINPIDPIVTLRGESIKTLAFNLTRSIVDTLVARIVAQKPRPRFMTQGGEYSDQERAKLLEQYVDGVIAATGAYYEMARGFKDSPIAGDGFTKVYPHDGEVCVERVPPESIMVDEYAARDRPPRSLYQIELISADALIELYPKHRLAIAECARSGPLFADPVNPSMAIETDEVEVIEAWHLPTTKDSGDGRHVISVRGTVLLDEEWDRQTFPFVHHQFCDCLHGFYGQGVAERQLPLQLEVNKIAQRIQEAMHYHAKADVYVEEGAIDEKHIKNNSGNIVFYKRGQQPPVVRQQGSMPAEVFRYLGDLEKRAFEYEGVSQMSASSKKPAGIESGVALMNLHDFETLRHGEILDRYQQSYQRLAEEIIACAAKLHEHSTDYEVHYRGKDFAKRIKWSEVSMERDRFVITVYPANLLPQTPAGRLETVQQLMGAGFIDRNEALKMLDMPDVRAQLTLSNAEIEDIDATCEDIILRGKYEPPIPTQGNLEFAIQRVTAKFLDARRKNVPDDRLDMLLQWIDDAEAILREAQPPPQAMAPQAAAPGMMPALPGVLPPL